MFKKPIKIDYSKTVRIICLFLNLCIISNCFSQSDGEEIRDNDFGIGGVVDLYSLGFEDCDLIVTDNYFNQYVIDYDLNDMEIKIIKLNDDGDQIMNYGFNGKVTIDSVLVQRHMKVKIYEDILYLLADDQDTVFLYSIQPDGQFTSSFGQGQRIVASDFPANFNSFQMDIIDDLIHIVSFDGSGSPPYALIEQFSLEGNKLFSDTLNIGENTGGIQIDFRPDEEIYIVNLKYMTIPPYEILLHFKRFKNLTELDSSFVYTIPHDNWMNFNFHIGDNEIITSYFINEFDIKHQRLDFSGQILSEEISPKIDTTESFIYMERSDILFNSNGYFVLEDRVNTFWQSKYLFTKYNSELKIDSTFGQDGSYELGNELGFVVKWRTYDKLDRIYMTFDGWSGKFNLIRTKIDEVSAIEKNAELKKSLTLYPNPTDSKLTIELENVGEGNFLYEVMDVNGIIKQRKYLQESIFEIDLSDYPIGIYFIRINSSKESYSRVIIKN